MKYAKILFTVLLSAIMIAFSITNSETVVVNISPTSSSVSLPLFLLIFISFMLGMVLTMLKYSFTNIKFKKEHFLKNQKIKALENEINNMRIETKLISYSENKDS